MAESDRQQGGGAREIRPAPAADRGVATRRFAELDVVALVNDIDAHGLRRGDLGAVVHDYADGRAYEVEFVATDGATFAVLTLDGASLRPFSEPESPS